MPFHPEHHHHRSKSVNPVRYHYIPPAHLEHLRRWSYSGADYSVLGRLLMQPYWNAVVQLLPLWVAPNVVTLSGFIVSSSSSLLLMYFFLLRGGEYPAWAWYYAAWALLTYQTLDAIDGKQARRTGSSSPLGELFDHGCDAFITPLVQLNIALAIGLTAEQTFLMYMLALSTLYFTIWEQYCTGTLDLGYINGPTEGILLTCAIFIMTGLNGSNFWLKDCLGPYDVGIMEVRNYRDCLMLFLICAATLTMSTNFIHVLSKKRIHNPAVAIPMLWLAAAFIAAHAAFPTLGIDYPFTMELLYGFSVSHAVTRLTLCRLCHIPFKPFTTMYVAVFVLLTAGIIVRYTHPALSLDFVEPHLGKAFLLVLLALIVSYVHLLTTVFIQISQFLHIRIFSLG